jgi:uncharacterized protein (TIRG00374 family)
LKSKKTEIISFLLGCAVFAYLVNKFGFDRIVENVEHAGWTLLYITGVWLAVYLLNTLSWKLALGDAGKGIRYSYLFLVTVSGFVINYITPFLALGGEPYKVKKLAAAVGDHNSLSAVVLFRMVHLLGHMLLLLSGLLLALFFINLPAALIGILILASAVISGIVFLTLLGNRVGLFKPMLGFLGRHKFLARPYTWLAQYEHTIEEMDEIVTGTFKNQRSRFYLSIFSEYLSRVCMGFEVYLILAGFGIIVSPVSALFVFVMYSIMINILFFVPMNVGVREGGIYLGLETIALPPLLSISLGIMMRIREFIWIMIGLVFILFTSDKHSAATASA